jgi:hypothetical protein
MKNRDLDYVDLDEGPGFIPGMVEIRNNFRPVQALGSRTVNVYKPV